MKNKLVCVVGPTASGKTALSIEIAKLMNTEIISSDSMQLYKKMDIGTAKPTMEEQAQVKHHMIDVCEPTEEFSVAKYAEMADACANDIICRGKIPVVVGGTGLYMNAFIEGNTFSGDEKDVKERERLQALYEEKGAHHLHELLQQVDPISAQRIHENNVKRVIRALEVYYQTGMTINELNQKNKPNEPKYDAIMIGVCPSDREILYDRINKRVDIMVKEGLLEETKYLFDHGYLVGTAGQAIGYKELIPYIERQDSLENCVEKLKQNSRNYAKRQLTWLKRDDRIHWIYYNKSEEFEEILGNSTRYLSDLGVI